MVLHDEAPCQYEDTIALFEYGFANFEKVNVAQTETRYRIEDTGLFYSGNRPPGPCPRACQTRQPRSWRRQNLPPRSRWAHRYAYEYLVGCKTGYTDTARSSLVACAERNGLKLISVVLHSGLVFVVGLVGHGRFQVLEGHGSGENDKVILVQRQQRLAR